MSQTISNKGKYSSSRSRLFIGFSVASLISILLVYIFLQNQYDRKTELMASEVQADRIAEKRQELFAAWQASQKFTLKIVNQMPDEYFGFRYTPEAMSFAEQWRHCAIYTCNQLSGRFKLEDSPYKDKSKRPPVDLDKEAVVRELNKMYDYVFAAIRSLPGEALFQPTAFAGDTISGWQFVQAMENHIIHHRGQCIVYLRLKGTIPKGYYGW